ncbi:MAG: Trm112 family protein, partial [Vicinamibacterales bacterium]
MRTETLDILRCPFCGGRLELVDGIYHRRTDTEITDGILACECCTFPVVDGIPVLHLQPTANAARVHIEQHAPALALRAMVGLERDEEAERFEAAAGTPTATFRDLVESLGSGFEGGYFLYRFSDPTFVVSEAVVRAVAGTVLGRAERAIDICGGSGHLTRSLMDLSSSPPVLADLYFAKVWLARRFTAPGCEPVCCDGNSALPFERGAFAYAMCSDAFMFIWTKRAFIGEMCRLVDRPGAPGTAVVTHTHNQLVWSPSHGNPLTPRGYRGLFETRRVRAFAEQGLFREVVRGGPLDLSRLDPDAVLDADAALTLIASDEERVFARHPLGHAAAARGVFRINPLYQASTDGTRLHLTLRFPDSNYEDEYGACREYLPDRTTL